MTVRALSSIRATVALLALGATACLERPVAQPIPNLQSGVTLSLAAEGIDEVDVLFEIDNSGSMRGNQENLAINLRRLIEGLVPTTGARSPIRSLRVGVITSDLGRLGAPAQLTCALKGDDARLNPFRNGPNTRALAATQQGMGIRPPPNVLCAGRADLPNFLQFSSSSTVRNTDDFRCQAFVGDLGCGIEQQLEAVYRALVVHGANEPQRSDAAPNGGFLRRNGILVVVVVTDEEDGSLVDCDNTHPDEPCSVEDRRRFDRIRQAQDGVFDVTSSRWAAIGGQQNLNNRFYVYAPGSDGDPTWPVDRYIRLGGAFANRGLLRLKPEHPERILFVAIAGVPLLRDIPTRSGTGTAFGQRRIDWDRLLGTGPADRGFTLVQPGVGRPSTEDGRISMQPAHVDCHCGGAEADGCRPPLREVDSAYTRVYPSCWRDRSPLPTPATDRRVPPGMPCIYAADRDAGVTDGGVTDAGVTDAGVTPTSNNAYFALPSRRIAEVARRFDALNDGNGMVYSVCEDDYRGVFEDLIPRILRRAGRCLPRPVETMPTECPTGSGLQNCVRTNCTVREFLPPGTNVSEACSPARGRTPGGRTALGQETCIVNQVALRLGGPPPTGCTGSPPSNGCIGFYYDTRPTEDSPDCRQHVEFTANAGLLQGATAELQCVQASFGAAPPADAATPADVGDAAVSDANNSQ